MDQASVQRIRDLVDARTGTQASLLTAFGLLCAGSADYKLVVRDAVTLLRRILPADTIGFFWSDPEGNMIDAYVEKPALLSVETFLAHQLFIEADPRNWPTFNENVLAGPVAGYLLPYQTENFYASNMFAVSYERIGARHIMDAVAHDGRQPFGSYLFMRSPEEGPFSAGDVDLALTIAHLTTLAFRPRGAAVLDSSRLTDAGLIVIGEDGHVAFYNNEAFQSLWLAERSGLIPIVGGPEVGFEDLAERFCADFVAAARTGESLSRQISCRWGDFEIRSEPAGGATVIRMMQSRPFTYHIAAKLVEWDLPARRLTVCWLALMGLSRKEIAAHAGISVDTVGEHLEAVFKRLGVTTTLELLLRVAA
jgi:DNA-binding CsgD family transcriptional regulator